MPELLKFGDRAVKELMRTWDRNGQEDDWGTKRYFQPEPIARALIAIGEQGGLRYLAERFPLTRQVLPLIVEAARRAGSVPAAHRLIQDGQIGALLSLGPIAVTAVTEVLQARSDLFTLQRVILLLREHEKLRSAQVIDQLRQCLHFNEEQYRSIENSNRKPACRDDFGRLWYYAASALAEMGDPSGIAVLTDCLVRPESFGRHRDRKVDTEILALLERVLQSALDHATVDHLRSVVGLPDVIEFKEWRSSGGYGEHLGPGGWYESVKLSCLSLKQLARTELQRRGP